MNSRTHEAPDPIVAGRLDAMGFAAAVDQAGQATTALDSLRNVIQAFEGSCDAYLKAYRKGEAAGASPETRAHLTAPA
jgi:hypothetical protein